MSEPSEDKSQSLILSPSTGLAKTSASLIIRGLSDLLVKTFHWKHHRLPFDSLTPKMAAVSCEGNVVTYTSPQRALSDEFSIEWHGSTSKSPLVIGFENTEPLALDEAISFSWSPEAKLFLVCRQRQGVTSRLWIYSAGPFREFFLAEYSSSLRAVAWSRDGSYLAAIFGDGGNGERLTLWHRTIMDWPPEQKPFEEIGHFSSDYFRDLASAENRSLKNSPSLDALAFSQDGTSLAVIENNDVSKHGYRASHVVFLKIPSLDPLTVEETTTSAGLDWYGNDNLVICGGHNFPSSIWELGLGQELLASQDLLLVSSMCKTNKLEELVAFGYLSRERDDVNVFDLKNHSLLGEPLVTKEVIDITWSRDGKKLYVLSALGDLWIGSND